MAIKVQTTGRNAWKKTLGCGLAIGKNQILFVEFCLGAGDVAQLVECLPSMHEALGFTFSTSKPNSGDAGNPSTWGREGRKIGSLRSF